MKCVDCGHVPQEQTPKFCSQCGKKMSPPATRRSPQDDGATSLPSNSEIITDPEDEVAADEASFSSSQLSAVPLNESGAKDNNLNVPPSKKKRQKGKKKGRNVDSDSTNSISSDTSSLEYSGSGHILKEENHCQEMETGKQLTACVPFSNTQKSSHAVDEDVDESASLIDSLSALQIKRKRNRKRNKSKGSNDPEATKSLPLLPTSLESGKISVSQDIESEEHLEASGDLHTTRCVNPLLAVQNDIPASNQLVKSADSILAKSHATDTKTTTLSSESKTNITPASEDISCKEVQQEETLVTIMVVNKEATIVGKKVESPNNCLSEGSSYQKWETSSFDNNNTAYESSQENSEGKADYTSVSKGSKREGSQNMKDVSGKNSNSNQEENVKGKQNKDNENKTKNPDQVKESNQPNKKSEANTKLQNDNGFQNENNKSESTADEAVASNSINSKNKESDKAKQVHGKGSKNNEQQSNDSKTKNVNSKTQNIAKQDKLQSEEQKTSNSKAAEPQGRQQERCTRSMDPDKFVTLYFHVIVSKDFNINLDEDKVVVKAGRLKGYAEWKTAVCEMHCTRALQHHGFLFEGNVKIHKENLDKGIPYKYVIERTSKRPEFEYIYFVEGPDKSHVNRCLLMPSEYVINREWHQYDDICMKENTGFINTLKKMMFNRYKDISTAKEIAGEIMLDSIFSILSTPDATNLSSFINQLRQFYFVYTESKVFVDKQGIRKWNHEFGETQIKKLIWKALSRIISPFLDKQQVQEDALVKNRLVAGLVSLIVVSRYNMSHTKEQLAQICCVLCLEKKPREHLLQDLENIKTVFSREMGMDILLKHLCQSCIDQDIDQWIWVLPLLHTFSVLSDQSDSRQEDVWAGLEGLVYDTLLKRFNKGELLPSMINKKHLLQADRALIRSWLFLVPMDDMQKFLEEIPITILDGLIACLYKFPKVIYGKYEKIEGILKKLLQSIQDLKDKTITADCLKSCCEKSLHLYNFICQDTRFMMHNELAALSAEIILSIIRCAELQGTSDAQELNAESQDTQIVLQKTLNITRKWFNENFKNRFKPYICSFELHSWSQFLYAGEISGDNVSLKWKESLLMELRKKIKQEEAIDQIKMYCNGQEIFKKLHMSINKSFEDCAIEAVHNACQTQTNILHQLDRGNLKSFRRLVSTIILNSWRKDEHGKLIKDSDEILQHLMQWTDATYIFKLYGTDSLTEGDEDIQDLVVRADSVFLNAKNSLMRGDLLVKHLECILDNEKQFLDICKLKKRENIYLSDVVEVLKWRRAELHNLKQERECVDSLLKMCQRISESVPVNTLEIQKKHNENLGQQKLNQLFTVKTLDCQNQQDEDISYYNLSQEVMTMAENLHMFKGSHIFITFWNINAQSIAQEEEDEVGEEDEETEDYDIEDLEQKLFTPCFKDYTRLYEDIKSGKVTFEMVDRHFKDFKNHYSELQQELKTMCRLCKEDNGNWIDCRVKQIEQYHQLHVAFESAKIISNLKKCLNLSGDFKTLDTLLQFADDFENYKQNPLSCISKEVMKTKEILTEITEEHTKCLQEVISRKDFFTWVQESLEDVNEVKVFVDLASISAGENDMDVDRVACFHDAVLGYSSLLYELKSDFGFDKLMHCLRKLWKALESDRKLPNKLRDSARHIEWLKTVKDSHGSVELSSLSLATTINRKGIYIIQAPKESKKITSDSVLRLTLPEDVDDSDNVRFYNLDELKELLNKLMLMSGKGEQGNVEVERFSEIFSNVQRLVKSFIDLYLAGNMLFRTWEATVYCSDDEKAGIKMRFNVTGVEDLEAQGSLIELLPKICKTMEMFLEQWVTFMNKERSQLYYLNYYTAEQLVFLCQQFQRRDMSEETLVMLSFIKRACTKMNTVKALYYPKVNLAKSPSSMDRPDKMVFASTFQRCTTVVEKLETVWNFSMSYMSFVFPDCVDIDTLGYCLAALADMEDKPVMRDLHPSLQQGHPNLILCPQSEILPTVIAIYMHSLAQQLPSYDEVLLCTSQTTFEEVALFLRRCLTPGNKEKKIYSLLYADELSYDTAYKSEQLFQHLGAQGVQDYNLVIVCNCDRDHCYIPSVFSQHKVHMIPHTPLENIQHYLQQHFAVGHDIVSAASCFKNGMSVGIVASKRAGVGKSLYVKRLHKQLETKFPSKRPILKIIRLIKPEVDENKVLQTLLPFLRSEHKAKPIIFHIDVTSSVNSGISEFLFKLLVLQYLMDSEGRIWKRQPYQLFIIEILESANLLSYMQPRSLAHVRQSPFIDFFPKISCCSPKEVLTGMTQNSSSHSCEDPGMDIEEFHSECFQRPYQYLVRFQKGLNLDTFVYKKDSVEGTPGTCLQIFLLYCGMIDPSWSELRNFAWFLNLQLKDCELSTFCKPEIIADTLPGFKNFVVSFMILMAKDFATPSLHITDQSPGRQNVNFSGIREEDLAPFLMRKKWESEPHPYIFFNDDHESMTFIGFHLRPNGAGGVDAINPRNGSVIKNNIMTTELYQALQLQKVPFNVDFDKLPRDEKISRLSMVLGIEWPFDPDDTYELTMDNILKILAIKMRLRCGIPVVIMGETGCGKTRLIKFLCHLSKELAETENMKLVKVHGGTSAETIYKNILEAQEAAIRNTNIYNCDTVLFFDEANTTDAISSIKEALCDHTVDGEPLQQNSGLQIIAACNPYRKHTQEMINRLESAGLGYRVKSDETKERLGSIPLRQLVYRVHALPPSMMPLVWDFGQLNDETEKKYIQQIVQRMAKALNISSNDIKLITNVLSASQSYMRKRNDECSFVSLRDVERCIEVFKWFYNHNAELMANMKKIDIKMIRHQNTVDWCLVLAVGVCYHASLEDKESYREEISELFPRPNNNPHNILYEITNMQDLFLSGVQLRDTIARNLALKENLFMMVVCIELKIPLFLVGKPGSSKSLAKTIVADAMQGQAAHSDLYRFLKQIHLVSFQCSPHSTPEGIIGTFKHCARFQEGKNLNEYVSVVVLDEIGLAEDSPKMPLKTLHPLLEDGCIEDDPLPHKKVGFIGISNWALDPAKMNRGIFVSRGDPSENELIESAKGICSSDQLVLEKVETYFSDFAEAYQEICETQKEQNKEFFGLRDFYSLIKMVFVFAKHSEKELTPHQIARAVLRNFSGKDKINPLDIFMPKIENQSCIDGNNTMDLVMENIRSDIDDNECRYLLILTKNYAALEILQHAFHKENKQPEIIFGSSFPKDQEYTQICRNINRVKICMETGQMVVLLNLQNLYESLYDALNQYYVYLAGQKYVDLGLGTHRVKCRVHQKFRLIVIEEKEVVYKDFPIPLINRLEKHYLDIYNVLSRKQKAVALELQTWINDFTAAKMEQLAIRQQEYSPSDVFVGYHSDTCASVILQVTENLEQKFPEDISEVKDKAKLVLLNCATPDSVIRHGNTELIENYFKRQNHSSLLDFLCGHLRSRLDHCKSFTEITTFSRLLTSTDKKILEVGLQNQAKNIEVLSLQQFDTEYSFLKKIRGFLEKSTGNQILIIQTDFEDGSQGAHLVASAKYSTVNEINKVNLEDVSVFVYFITKLPRMQGGTSYVGFRGGLWQSAHIDDLRKSKDMVSDITALQNHTISQLFHDKATIIKQETDKLFEKNQGLISAEIETPMVDVDETNEIMDFESTGETALENQEMEIDIVSDTKTQKEIPDQESLANPEDILDTTILIRNCVQNAIGMLRDDESIASRSTRRVEILIHLLSRPDQIQGGFLRILKIHLHHMLKAQEEVGYGAQEWVVREASNPDALQEAGTFRQTLWKRVQTAVTPNLAHLLSIVDCDANLEILVNSRVGDTVKSLWMFIFSNEVLLNISYNQNEKSSQTNTMLVKNYINIRLFEASAMPFSWRIKDYLEVIRAQAQHITHHQDHGSKLLSIYSKGPLAQYISTLSEDDQHHVFLLYKRDFILLTMNVSSSTELKLMELSLSLCIEELKQAEKTTEMTLPWVHLAYHKFQHRLQNVSRILAINPLIINDLIQMAEKPESLMNHGQMVIDIYAAIASLERLKSSILTPDPQTWLHQVKNVQIPIELVCSENYLQNHSPMCSPGINEIRCLWNGLFSMALFVEHVMLGNSAENAEMQDLLQVNTIFLGKALERFPDLKTRTPFMTVLTMLHKCRDEIGILTSRFGVPLCTVCQEDPKDPVCLTCDHVYCLPCIKHWIESGRNSCPTCKVSLPENFTMTVSEDIRDAIQRNVQFRQRCNGFFIDLICTLCFKDNTPPDKEVIQHLLSLLFVTKACPIDQSGERKYTKDLSPFDDAVDKTPVIRSVILKLLLKYSFDDIMEYVQDYLHKVQHSHFLTREDTIEVYMLFINCLEDSLYEKGQLSTADMHLKEEGEFLKHYLQTRHQHRLEEPLIFDLQEIARIRLALDMTAEVFYEETSGIPAKREFLQHVMNLCAQSGNDWYRIYLIRRLANQHGVEAVQKLFKDQKNRWIFPVQIFLKQVTQTSQIDLFLVCGDRYKCLRDGLGKALIECKEESFIKAQEECKSPDWELCAHTLLSVFREITMQHGVEKLRNKVTVVDDSVKICIQKMKCLQERKVQHFLHSLLINNRPLLKVVPQMTSLQGTVTGLVTHFAAVLLSMKNNLLAPLRNLAFSPNRMQNSYLPTMPEDMFGQLKNAIPGGVRWYLCPNGHYCAVGECGQPMESSNCVDCGAVIGGINHKPHDGFQQMQQEIDQTQTGHVLGSADRQGNAVAPDRQISAPVFTILRLLTHLAMLLGIEEDMQILSGIVKPAVSDVSIFVFHHIAKGLEQLKNTLGKSADETTTVIHLVLCRMLQNSNPQPGHWPVRFDETWSTKEGRNNWETHMDGMVVAPVLQNLNEDLLKVNNAIRNDDRISSNPIVKIIYGDPLANGEPMTLPQDTRVHCSKVWSCREKISIEYLRHVVQQKNGKETVPILCKFLEKETELRMVKLLPEILNLQKELIKIFQNSQETNQQTIGAFLASSNSGKSCVKQYEHIKKRIKAFIYAWNHLKQSLHNNGEIKLPEGMCEDLTLTSEISFLLPRRQGRGLCATALVSYLITLHNSFVHNMETYTNNEQKYSISASEVMDLHVISYEREKDLVPIILANCQYSVQSGQGTVQEFDLHKIQNQIASRFLQGKPLITVVGLPTLTLAHDLNYKIIFTNVKKKLPQDSLPHSTMNSISRDLSAYSDVCEALHIVNVTLGFLATSGGNPDALLTTYVKNILQMVEDTNVHILEALKRCHLKHILAVWQLLTALKSEHLLRLKMDPFAEVDKAYKQPLNQDTQQKLNAFLEQNGPNLFLLELHEMIILKLKQPQSTEDFRPSWLLKDTLGPLLFEKNIDFPELENDFPEQIALAHCIEAWKITATKKWNRLRK
ncbi:LOW QUALITY PROTEIN: E3 ubiquitin-protein ligase RNF213 [Pelodytes ibericus]